MKIVSVILARGGSKGIPKKNVIDLCGHPLIYFVINTSLNSNVNETWVSTDDDEIARISESLGVKVIKRPVELAQDNSSSEDALMHFANNVEFDILVFIQPTSPLIIPSDINKGIKMMDVYDSVFSAYVDDWKGLWNENLDPIHWDVYNRPRRQEIGKIYVENGAFYITKRSNLLKSKLRYSGKIGVIIMPFLRSLQIDNYDELDLIRSLIEKGFFKEKQ